MKKITILLSFAVATTFFACGNHDQHKTNSTTTTPAQNNGVAMYECPMKCEAASDKPGKCTKCKMDLVAVKN
jgi:hypothetical protein